MRSGKMEFETLAKILLLTAFLIIVLLLFKGCIDAYRDLGTVGMREYTCWATNLMKANVVSVWPSTCREQIVKDKVDTKTFGRLMGTCWWEYGQGKWDMGPRKELDNWDDYFKYAASAITESDTVMTCYALIPKEDIKVDELKTYMETHNVKGDKVTKVKDTMWNYLQEVAKGDNVCFDENFDENDGGMLKKGEIYYIKFLDDRGTLTLGTRDLLIITRNKGFFDEGVTNKNFWINLFGVGLCYRYGSVKGTPEIKSQKIDSLITKMQTCAKIDSEKECLCESVDITDLDKYRVFGSKTSRTSMVQFIGGTPPGAMYFVNAGIKIECPPPQPLFPAYRTDCNSIVIDMRGKARTEEIADVCCEMEEMVYLVHKEEKTNEKVKKILIVTTKKPTLENCKK